MKTLAQSYNQSLISPFNMTQLPQICFGNGVFSQLVSHIIRWGKRPLLVTGASSFRKSPQWSTLIEELTHVGIIYETYAIAGEPTPYQVDQAVTQFSGQVDVVVGLGGGSALDAAKAIAGLLGLPEPFAVRDFLEGVGVERAYTGPSLPFIAVPTTAGTGSELTKNAVITQHGAGGFKKSFRDDQLLAKVAIVDPELLHSCPRSVMVANAMDALTQLIESYTSPKANPMTLALVESGLTHFVAAFDPSQVQPVNDYAGIAYAAMISGLCLAQTGLGAVHGIASPLGAYFSIPHGEACGILLADTTAVNVAAMQARDLDNVALCRYHKVAELLGCGGTHELVALMHQWQCEALLPSLSSFGITEQDFASIVAASGGNSMKTNPIKLSPDELEAILLACI